MSGVTDYSGLVAWLRGSGENATYVDAADAIEVLVRERDYLKATQQNVDRLANRQVKRAVRAERERDEARVLLREGLDRVEDAKEWCKPGVIAAHCRARVDGWKGRVRRAVANLPGQAIAQARMAPCETCGNRRFAIAGTDSHPCPACEAGSSGPHLSMTQQEVDDLARLARGGDR